MTFGAPVISLLLTLVLLVSSCGTVNRGMQRLGLRVRSRHSAVLLLDPRISERANRNRPVSVDLVLVYEEDLEKQLAGLTGNDWFSQRDQMQVDHRDALAVFPWEWVPGQEVSVQAVPLSPRVIAGFLFAQYDSPGDHRIRVDPREDIRVEFRENGFEVRPIK